MEFVPQNFSDFKHGLAYEEKAGAVPGRWSTTSQLRDPLPPTAMRVKSGYTGHVPNGRDYISGSYKSMNNPGTAGKPSVPIIHRNPRTGDYDVRTQPVPSSEFLYHDPFKGEHDPFNSKHSNSKSYEYGKATTAPVAMRIEKVLSGDDRDMSDADNLASTLDMDGAGQWVMTGYTGHVPKAREVYGTSYYGPPEGPSYHGPFYTSDVYGQPGSPNREAICP